MEKIKIRIIRDVFKGNTDEKTYEKGEILEVSKAEADIFVQEEKVAEIVKKDYEQEIIKSEVTDGLVRLPEGLTEEELRNNAEKIKLVVGEAYETLINTLKKYSDLREEYYHLVAIWIMGTYIHKEFNTYPYLFINAMRGSGKTRLLKLIASFSKNGEVLTSLREAVLFRDCKDKTILIDEFEGIASKENQPIRELLNAGYKKGNKVKRLKRVKKITGDEYEIEAFEIYTPICLANIWGMEEVLSDRCISLVLEKSNNIVVTKILENFDNLDTTKWVKRVFFNNLVELWSYFSGYGYMEAWNDYILYKYTNTLTTLTPLTTDTPPKQNSLFLEMFNKIDETGISGRSLELMFPLFLVSRCLSEKAFEMMLKIAKMLNDEKREDEMIESRDISFIDFVSRQISSEFIPIKEVTFKFREFVGEEDDGDKWLNTRWVGRAIKRLNLSLDKRKMSHGNEVRLNIKKANEKMMAFRGDK